MNNPLYDKQAIERGVGVVYVGEESQFDRPTVFLAGPTLRAHGPNDRVEAFRSSWRRQAVQLFAEMHFAGTLLVPEWPNNGVAEVEHTEQMLWEYRSLSQADCVLFWVPRDMNRLPGLTTNIEFGMWVATRKVVYGRPNDAAATKALDFYAGVHNVTVSETLHGTVHRAIALADAAWSGRHAAKVTA